MASRVFWRSWVEAELGGSACQLALAVPRPRCGRPRPTGFGTSFFDLDAFKADHYILDKLGWRRCFPPGLQETTAPGGRAMVVSWLSHGYPLHVLTVA